MRAAAAQTLRRAPAFRLPVFQWPQQLSGRFRNAHHDPTFKSMPIDKRLRLALFLLPVLLLGCKEPTGGASAISSIVILQNSVPFEEQSIAVGDGLQLTASPRDGSNRPLEGLSIEWSSSPGNVASVDASGAVRGLAIGTAWIRAASGGVRDSARVNVSERFTGLASCGSGEAGIQLQVGGVHVTSAFETPTLCVRSGAAGTEYVLVPFHASAVAGGEQGSRLTVELTASGTVTSSVSETGPKLSPLLERSSLTAAGTSDDEFHLRLRERTLRELRPRIRSMQAPVATEPSQATLASSPTVGQILQINVRTDTACAAPRNRSGRVVAVTNRAVVVADESNPSGGFTDSEYAAFGARFDNLIHPLATETFGHPHDLDSNQRVIIFFTRAVNDLTTSGSGFYIGGFFFDRDLFPRSGQGACAGSNVGEILYLMVPDPQRGINERPFRKENVERRTVAVIGHELQHLINASRRLHVNRATVWEETWLNEGLSHAMEELLFYRETGLLPRGNHGAEILGSHGRAFEEYQLDNFERIILYLASPSSNSVMAGNTLAMRGAAWSFLRYAADRRTGAERDFWYQLANSKTFGIANLRSVLGTDPLPWVHDWTVSLHSDDHIATTDARFQQPSWNYRSIVPASRILLGQANPSYPLTVTFLRNTSTGQLPIVLSLQSGGASHHRFGVNAGQTAAIRTTSGGLQAPSKLKLALIRTR
ncbi:hypothetical protein BH23GEM8_BH23GEM8_15020 [soil metagenome]